MATKKTTKKTERFVLISTKTRNWLVLAGILDSEDGDTVTLRDARMIAYFSPDAHGLLGVAASGPGSSPRVSPRVDSITVRGVETVIDCTAEARARIEGEPWH